MVSTAAHRMGRARVSERLDEGTDRLDRMNERLATLEAERAITETISRYCHSVDYGLEDEWLDCFEPDAVFDIHLLAAVDEARFPNRGGTPTADGVRYSGRAELAEYVARHTRAPALFHKHLPLPSSIELSGDSATAVTYMVRLDVDAGGTVYVRAFGRYLDELRRDDGAWRIRHRVCEIEAWDGRIQRGAGSAAHV
jgi:hypothetical protein